MYIKVQRSTPILPFDHDDLTEQQESEFLNSCPVIDLRLVFNQDEVETFLIDLFAYYFQLPKANISADADLLDDIERQVWAKELDVPYDDVTYGRIFCGKDESGQLVGGMSDKGIIMAALFLFDFGDAVGVDALDACNDDNTFDVGDDDFANYSDCKNIKELAELLFSVKSYCV